MSVPAVGQNLWQPSNQTAKQDAPLPGVDEILDRYVLAVGGRQAIERVTSRVLKGSRVGADGVLVPEEVYAKAPNKLLTVTSYPNQVFRIGFDGAHGWAGSNQGGRDLGEEMLAQLRREAEFYKETRLKEMYSKMTVLGRATVGERAAYVVEATPVDGGSHEKLFFDVQTGLLVRKYSLAKTALGQFPAQTDYEDYREVDGVKLPFTIRWAIPGRTWGRKVTEVKQNVPLDDAQFNPRAEILREKGTDRSRFFRGEIDKYTWVDVGSSYLPADLLAAFLCAQLQHRDQIQSMRGQIWEIYARELASWAEANAVRLPIVPAECEQSYHMFYVIMPSFESRQALISRLAGFGILAVFHYLPLHLSPMGLRFGGRQGECPVTEDLADRLLRLPFFTGMNSSEESQVIEAVRGFRC